jgi:GDPmannose 4,6-dehydratase
MSKKVLISGILGQDGANLAEYLLKNTDHIVYGMIRRASTPNYINLKAVIDNPRFNIVVGDLADEVSLNKLVEDIKPDYFVNFAANSFVKCSWDMPVQVFDSNALGVMRCLEAIRRYKPDCRFYSAGSSEEFGDVLYSPQDVNHPLRPRSPYGASKCAARHITKVYRESYGLYAVHGILFNHEGTKRGAEFVTRKITKNVARIKKAIDAGQKFEPLELGNIDAKRDWSDSEDFVEGVWMMLNQEQYNDELFKKLSGYPVYLTKNPKTGAESHLDTLRETQALAKEIKEYVLASGETHSIREFIELAFREVGINGIWTNLLTTEAPRTPLNEVYLLQPKEQAAVLVKINPKFYRPAEVELLLGDSTPIRNELGWKPKTSFPELVRKMVRHDLALD